MGSSDLWEQICSTSSHSSVTGVQCLPALQAENFLQQVFLMSVFFFCLRAFHSWLIALVLSVVPNESWLLEKSQNRGC